LNTAVSIDYMVLLQKNSKLFCGFYAADGLVFPGGVRVLYEEKENRLA
jgi:hypothetical protein